MKHFEFDVEKKVKKRQNTEGVKNETALKKRDSRGYAPQNLFID